jgi:hypothetical protein
MLRKIIRWHPPLVPFVLPAVAPAPVTARAPRSRTLEAA